MSHVCRKSFNRKFILRFVTYADCLWTGFKLRKRQIINEPTGGPGNCPHLVEAVACDEPSCYTWLLVSLDPCIPDDENECGPGTQLSQVQCVNSNGKRGEVSPAQRSKTFAVKTECSRLQTNCVHSHLNRNLVNLGPSLILGHNMTTCHHWTWTKTFPVLCSRLI